MNQNILLVLFVMQFVIQYIAYRQSRVLIYWFVGPILHDTFDVKAKDLHGPAVTATITLNILISLAVKYFTASGAMAGTSNLFASCLLGAFMYYDVNKFVKLIEKSER